MSLPKPKARSKLRAYLGIRIYTSLKHIYWFLHKNNFSGEIINEKLPHVIFAHQTPLLRKLKDVDMVYQYNKVTNLKIAVRTISGLILEPGKKFSYWKRIGNLTKKKGYIEGIELYGGKFRPAVGGGLCQLSNLLYWSFLHTPMIVTERHRHSYDVFPDVNRKLPFGSGATCYYPFMDLEILNSTNQRFQIILEVTDEYLVGEIRSDQPIQETYLIKEIEPNFKSEYWGGYSRNNKIIREVYAGNVLVKTESITENHAMCMYSPLLETKKH